MSTAWPGAILRSPAAQLFLTSFLGLYAELLCIRWMPAHVRFLSYFTNFILLASFLGLGVGILSARIAGGPRTIDVSLFETAISYLPYQLIGYLGTGHVPGRHGTGFGLIVPTPWV